jgi:O-acetyl-ADP-ribose deacetylase (regulator of RNase III)
MNVHLVFFDHQQPKVDEYRQILRDIETPSCINFSFVVDDVRELVKKQTIHALVSPANCLGFMDGGIDLFYMCIFPGIQDRVKRRIASFGITTSLGRPILPIGSAMMVPTLPQGGASTRILICVPTMFLPEDITSTRNVYWAMTGLLRLLQSSSIKGVIGVPCMGTGVGKMSATQSAEQIRDAIRDFAINSETPTVRSPVPGKHSYVLREMACQQPITYSNTEIQPETMQQVIDRS